MQTDKQTTFDKVEALLTQNGFNIISVDMNRPWGGFFVIDENQAQEFANQFFDGIDIATLKIGGKLSPKILVVAPKTRLSWQYHHRRAEIWQVLCGKVGISVSADDVEGEMKIFNPNEQIKLERGERHRLIGLAEWGVVAEIWQHTNSNEPSDENDIVRVQDDFGR